MNPIRNAWLCQIDVTNVCSMSCVYCTRWTRHIRKDQHFYMSLDELDRAFDSLENWPSKKIGIIGGEPTLHPEFEELCKLVKRRKGDNWVLFFTIGGKRYENYMTLIKECFNDVNVNSHDSPLNLHQKLTIAVSDVVKDEKFKNLLIDKCWVQKYWCPTIANKGAFFCEVAYAIDMIYDGPGGYKVEKGWWLREPPFTEQLWACELCGMCIPMERQCVSDDVERISPSVLEMMKKHNNPLGKYELFDKVFSKTDILLAARNWTPGCYQPGKEPGGFEL